ncbi:phosphate ABC transporter permease subunit PstC [Halobacteriales archaeon Cl-PHB]
MDVTRRLKATLPVLVGLPRRFVAWLAGLPRRFVQFLVDLPRNTWEALLATKRVLFGSDPDPDEAAFSLALLLTLGAVIVTFLVDDALTPYPLAGFAVLVGLGWSRYQSRTAKILTVFATAGTVLTLGFITFFLFERAWTPIADFGLELLAIPVDADGNTRWFFWLDAILPQGVGQTGWDPANDHPSLLAATWATVVVTTVAGLVAGPLGVLGALFIAEIASDGVREVIKPAVEILAGIPSIVYGFIGFAVLNSFMQDAFLDAGSSFLIAGLVVGVMALPTVVSVAEDAITAVPSSMRDGSVAMGATEWQTMKSISIPAAFSGISAAVILGLGRAIGETMAVAAIMAAGTTFAFPLYDIFDQSVTLTSRIATSYGSASGTTLEVLFVAGVMLFTIVSIMSLVAQYIERRMNRELKGER